MTYIRQQVKQAFDEMREEDGALQEAVQKLKPFIGEINTSSFKDANALYEYFFKQLGVDVSDVPASAYPAMIGMLSSSQLKGMVERANDRGLARDSAGKGTGFYDRWPEAAPKARR